MKGRETPLSLVPPNSPRALGRYWILAGRIDARSSMLYPFDSVERHILLSEMPDMLEAVGKRIDMPDYMREQMPDLLSDTMAALMPNMLPLLMPRIVPAKLAHLKEGRASGVSHGKAARIRKTGRRASTYHANLVP